MRVSNTERMIITNDDSGYQVHHSSGTRAITGNNQQPSAEDNNFIIKQLDRLN